MIPEFQGTEAVGSSSLLAFPDYLHSLDSPCALARQDLGGQIWALSQWTLMDQVRDSGFQPFPLLQCKLWDTMARDNNSRPP